MPKRKKPLTPVSGPNDVTGQEPLGPLGVCGRGMRHRKGMRVTVEYTANDGTRRRVEFDNERKARAFYLKCAEAGKNPAVARATHD